MYSSGCFVFKYLSGKICWLLYNHVEPSVFAFSSPCSSATKWLILIVYVIAYEFAHSLILQCKLHESRALSFVFTMLLSEAVMVPWTEKSPSIFWMNKWDSKHTVELLLSKECFSLRVTIKRVENGVTWAKPCSNSQP